MFLLYSCVDPASESLCSMRAQLIICMLVLLQGELVASPPSKSHPAHTDRMSLLPMSFSSRSSSSLCAAVLDIESPPLSEPLSDRFRVFLSDQLTRVSFRRSLPPRACPRLHHPRPHRLESQSPPQYCRELPASYRPDHPALAPARASAQPLVVALLRYPSAC